MKKIKKLTTILAILFIMAISFEWGMAWKLMVGGLSAYILVLIVMEVLKRK